MMSKHSETIESVTLAIRDVMRGEQYFSPELNDRLVDSESDKSSRLSTLADRELEVLRQLSLGRTNKEFSDDLHISLRSVEKEVFDLKQKLNLATTNELLMFATREGLVFPELVGQAAGAMEELIPAATVESSETRYSPT